MEKGSKKIKLLIITQKVDKEDSNLGFFHRWLKEFSLHTSSLKVIALGVGKYDLPENVEVFSVGKSEGHSKIKQFFTLQKLLLKNLREASGLFIHMCPEYVLAAAPLAWLFRKKIILWYTHKSVTWKLSIAEKLVNKVLTASEESFRMPSKKVAVTGHGIDMDRFSYAERDLDRGQVNLLFVGRICSTKDIETSLKALKILHGDGLNVVFNIIGEPYLDSDKSYFEGLQAMVRALDLHERVNFLGKVPNEQMPEIYKTHDILLHSSDTGSLDKVVLEALACGTYVLSSSEAFAQFSDEFRWPANDPAHLAQKIQNILIKKPDLRQLSDKVRSEHNLKSLIPRILKYY